MTGAAGDVSLPSRRTRDLDPERCTAVLGTLQEISVASPTMESCCRILGAVSHLLEAEQGVLMLCNPLTRDLEFVLHNQDPEIPRRYVDYYWRTDPTGLAQYIRGDRDSLAYPTVPQVFDLMNVIDYASLKSSEFYNDFCKTSDIHFDLVMWLPPSSATRGALCLHRSSRKRPFTREDAAVMNVIAPFLNAHLDRIGNASLHAALSTAGERGIILCDARGRVLFCNDAARRLCLPLQAGGSRRRFEEVGGEWRSGGQDNAHTGVSRVAPVEDLARAALNDPTALADDADLTINASAVRLDDGAQGVMITLEARGQRDQRRSETLRKHFGLSEREIEVLERMLAGESNRAIAQGLFVSESTVKKHMQSIASKVGERTRTAIANAVNRILSLDS